MSIFRHIANHSLWAILSVLSTLIIILLCVYTYMMLALPSVDKLRDVHLQVPLKVYSHDGRLMAQYGVKRRIPVRLSEVPKPLIQAVLATEDARFYEHPGVDFIGLARAAKAVVLSGRKVQGASTITMQVARNFFLNRKKTYVRKFNEILLAIKIDKTFSKDKILELYLNKIYLGQRAYGVAAAAQVYYGKRLGQLTLPEMAMIAGLPKAPSANNPIRNPVAALARRNHVLARMLEVGFIDQSAYDQAVQAPLTAKTHKVTVELNAPYVSEMVRRVIVAQYGDKAYDLGLQVYTTLDAARQQAAHRALMDGLLAYDRRHGYRQPTKNLGEYTPEQTAAWLTHLKGMPVVAPLLPAAVVEVRERAITVLKPDGDLANIEWSGLAWARPYYADRAYPGPRPRRADAIVKEGDVVYIRPNKASWVLAQLPLVQGAIVSLNPKTGAIEALSGGFDFDLSRYNRVTQAVRQAGSSFKPFIYSAALAKGFTLATLINDAPVVVKDNGENRYWRPRNDTLRFYGPTPVRTGLIKSRNLVSIRLLQETGLPFALDYLPRFGFEASQLPNALSLALGSASVTPLQLATGYSVFANGGYRVQPFYIDHIIDRRGEVVYQAAPVVAQDNTPVADDAAKTQAMHAAPAAITPQNAYLITDALKAVIQQGTGRRAKALGRQDLAGKTGTTNDQVDAWFSGYNPDLVTTVWVGFDNSQQSLYEYGSKAALPIWMQYMREALAGTPDVSMPEPTGLVRVRIDPETGLLAAANDPKARFELFRVAHVPTQQSDLAVQSAPTPQVTTDAPAVESAGQAPAMETPLF